VLEKQPVFHHFYLTQAEHFVLHSFCNAKSRFSGVQAPFIGRLDLYDDGRAKQTLLDAGSGLVFSTANQPRAIENI
jgi:hypothetical protein